MDDAIGKGIASLLESQFYSRVVDIFDDIDDDIKKTMGQLMGLTVVFLPLLLCLVLFLINLYKKSGVDTKREILKVARNYSSRQKSLDPSLKGAVSEREILDQKQLMDIVKRAAPKDDIPNPGTAFSINNFGQMDVAEQVVKTQGQVVFKEVPLDGLMRTIQNLARKSQVRITDIKMEKNEKKQLSGFLNVIHYVRKKNDEANQTR